MNANTQNAHSPGPMEQKLIDAIGGRTLQQADVQRWRGIIAFAREQDAIRAELASALHELVEAVCADVPHPTQRLMKLLSDADFVLTKAGA